MPKRVRSHELEEESVRRFKDALPPKWIYRTQTPDYGIDGSVEIFNSDGESTGLSFLVQLRATDDSSQADRVRLKTDELKYYQQFDHLVAVVRYCSSTNGFFWQWAHIISAKADISDGQESATYKFCEDERWTEGVPTQIQRTLDVRRALANFPASAAIPIRLDLEPVRAEDRYKIERAFAQAITASKGKLTRVSGKPRPIEIMVRAEPIFLSVRIDQLASITFDLIEPTANDFVNSALYAIVFLLGEARLPAQAEDVARLLIEYGQPHPQEKMAFAACQALANDLLSLVSLAKINGFQHQTSLSYGLIISMLAHAAQDDETRRRAMNEFFESALKYAQETASGSEAATHYSIANFYRNHKDTLRSVTHYNRARKLRPSYLKTYYFLRELAGVLYESRRYLMATHFYRQAAGLDDDPVLRFLLGDALMQSGRVGEAEASFRDVVANCKIHNIVIEAELKAEICAWLVKETGSTNVRCRRFEAKNLFETVGDYSPGPVETILSEVDSLNPLARFNYGVSLERRGKKIEALYNFLLCAFVHPSDIEAWKNASICALSVKNLALLWKIITVSIQYNGSEFYDRLREDLISQGAIFIVELDNMVLSILESKKEDLEEEFTLRFIDEEDRHRFTVSVDRC